MNLRRVDVGILRDEIADILVALGSRVRVLSIDHGLALNASWREVFTACTNLEAVRLVLYGAVQAADVLPITHTKLVFLKLGTLDDSVLAEDRFLSALSTCSVLRNVDVRIQHMGPEAFLGKFLECLKSVTTMACTLDYSDAEQNKHIIDAIASHLTNLESLTISARKPLQGEDVNALVRLPRLKAVALRHQWFFSSLPKPQEQFAVEIVEILKHCAPLVQLYIDSLYIKNRSQRIAEAAVAYRRKHFDMFICGIQYRTW